MFKVNDLLYVNYLLKFTLVNVNLGVVSVKLVSFAVCRHLVMMFLSSQMSKYASSETTVEQQTEHFNDTTSYPINSPSSSIFFPEQVKHVNVSKCLLADRKHTLCKKNFKSSIFLWNPWINLLTLAWWDFVNTCFLPSQWLRRHGEQNWYRGIWSCGATHTLIKFGTGITVQLYHHCHNNHHGRYSFHCLPSLPPLPNDPHCH